jgi:hypothetical protein
MKTGHTLPETEGGGRERVRGGTGWRNDPNNVIKRKRKKTGHTKRRALVGGEG